MTACWRHEGRFFAKVEPEPMTGCYLWIGANDGRDGGYGTFWWKGRRLKAHRWAYAHTNGPIADGLVIDHICRNRACVNPDPLRAVTMRENTMAPGSLAITKAAAEKSHCKKGHPLLKAKSQRFCQTCANEASRRYRRRLRDGKLEQ